MAEEKDRMLVEYETKQGMVKLNPNIVRKYLVHGKAHLVTNTELVMFIQMCRFMKMNPYLHDCYLIKYSETEPATVVTGKDWFTKTAASVPHCEGYNSGIVVRYKKGNKSVVERRIGTIVRTDEEEELIGGWATARRKGWVEPVEAEVSLKEYMRFSKKGEPTRSWREMPATMIKKVALVQALREAFPDVYGGVYSPEEMPIEPTDLPDEPVTVPEQQESLPVREETPNGDVDTIIHDDGTEEKLPQADDQEELGIF